MRNGIRLLLRMEECVWPQVPQRGQPPFAPDSLARRAHREHLVCPRVFLLSELRPCPAVV